MAAVVNGVLMILDNIVFYRYSNDKYNKIEDIVKVIFKDLNAQRQQQKQCQ